MTTANLDVLSLLKEKIETRQARIGIVGMGYVDLTAGPPLQRRALPGYRLRYRRGQGRKTQRRWLLYCSHSPRRHSGSAKGWLSRNRRLYSQIADMVAVIICVPTPLNEHHEPDLSYVTGTVASIASAHSSGPVDCARKHHLPRHHRRNRRPLARGRQPAPDQSRTDARASPASTWSSLPSAKIPATTPLPATTFPRLLAAAARLPQNSLPLSTEPSFAV